ncbi:probable serine/threonine-protein kinase fhkB [Culex quinquefasciatus]|uniref:probable serine/threonine-protein kinase fhkB n=1 Tax=Culex quinquefasciatus TaxID=7176 RepID=UPI0018E313F9|nr:probable serine/threonine-protein kinase fhkB [Culex quinquefasciatus]
MVSNNTNSISSSNNNNPSNVNTNPSSININPNNSNNFINSSNPIKTNNSSSNINNFSNHLYSNTNNKHFNTYSSRNKPTLQQQQQQQHQQQQPQPHQQHHQNLQQQLQAQSHQQQQPQFHQQHPPAQQQPQLHQQQQPTQAQLIHRSAQVYSETPSWMFRPAQQSYEIQGILLEEEPTGSPGDSGPPNHKSLEEWNREHPRAPGLPVEEDAKRGFKPLFPGKKQGDGPAGPAVEVQLRQQAAITSIGNFYGDQYGHRAQRTEHHHKTQSYF